MVRRMIVKALTRSAIIAWDSRPRDLRTEIHNESGKTGGVKNGGHKEEHLHISFWHRSHVDSTIIPVSADWPPWGHVSHPGWASPASDDYPNLQYWSVIPELPNLIEAKAVSLAPPDPAVDIPFQDSNTPHLPDAQVVALLQRPAAMGLREYLSRLSSYGLINPPSLGPKFLSQYEYARFSSQPLTETEFRNLMAVFAEVLNGMTELDLSIIEEARADLDGNEDQDTYSLAPSQSSSNNSTGSAIHYRSPHIGALSSFSYSPRSSFMDAENRSPHTLHTTSSIPQQFSPGGAQSLPRTPSLRSFGSGSVRIRPQRSPSTILPNSSTSSLARSNRSAISLNLGAGEGELPYQLHF